MNKRPALYKNPLCWFAGKSGMPCGGRLQRCHFLPKQRYRHLPEDVIWDDRAWKPGCWDCHQRLDNRRFYVLRSELPEAFFDWAAENELLWMAGREYPREAA